MIMCVCLCVCGYNVNCIDPWFLPNDSQFEAITGLLNHVSIAISPHLCFLLYLAIDQLDLSLLPSSTMLRPEVEMPSLILLLKLVQLKMFKFKSYLLFICRLVLANLNDSNQQWEEIYPKIVKAYVKFLIAVLQWTTKGATRPSVKLW